MYYIAIIGSIIPWPILFFNQPTSTRIALLAIQLLCFVFSRALKNKK